MSIWCSSVVACGILCAATALGASSSHLVRVSTRPMLRKILSYKLPTCPEASMIVGERGLIIGIIQLNPIGHVQAIELESPPEGPVRMGPFVTSALTSIRKWVFKPSTINGDPVTVVFKLYVYFDCRDVNPQVVIPDLTDSR